jgi:hypothetical protein
MGYERVETGLCGSILYTSEIEIELVIKVKIESETLLHPSLFFLLTYPHAHLPTYLYITVLLPEKTRQASKASMLLNSILLASSKKKRLSSYTYIHNTHAQDISPPLAIPLNLLDIKQLLQLDNKLPLILTNVVPEELLECVDTLTANCRVQRIVFFQVATIHGLVSTFDFDSNGRLALFAYLDLLVVALDRGAINHWC